MASEIRNHTGKATIHTCYSILSGRIKVYPLSGGGGGGGGGGNLNVT